MPAWLRVYRMASAIGLAQALDALEGLTGELGLAGGLHGWADLAQRMDDGQG